MYGGGGGMYPGSPGATVAAPQGPLGPLSMTPMSAAPHSMPTGLAMPVPSIMAAPAYIDASTSGKKLTN